MHSLYSPEEINDLIRQESNDVNWLQVFAGEYEDLSFIDEQRRAILESVSQTEILHVSEHLWILHNTLIAVHERLGRLIHKSLYKKHYVDWREDEELLLRLRRVLGNKRVEKAISKETGELSHLLSWTRAQFLKEGKRLIRGSTELASSMQEISLILQKRDEAEGREAQQRAL